MLFGGLDGSGDGNFRDMRMNLQVSTSATGAGAASGAPTKMAEKRRGPALKRSGKEPRLKRCALALAPGSSPVKTCTLVFRPQIKRLPAILRP